MSKWMVVYRWEIRRWESSINTELRYATTAGAFVNFEGELPTEDELRKIIRDKHDDRYGYPRITFMQKLEG